MSEAWMQPPESIVGTDTADELASALACLGYPGYSHLRFRLQPVHLRPEDLILRTITQQEPEVRTMEGLPWVLSTRPDLDWEGLVASAEALGGQNRLGFLMSLALDLGRPQTARQLSEAMAKIKPAEHEDTLCHRWMSPALHEWILKYRPPAAARWKILSTLTVADLTHAAER